MLERQSEAILALYLCSPGDGERASDLKWEALYLTGCADGLKAVLPGKCFTGLSQSLLFRRLDYARVLKNGGRLTRLLNEYLLSSFDGNESKNKPPAALLLERVRDLAARGR
ncbi:MAG TPA: hypothetical protein PKH78_08275, partial [Candidatus Obscuribacter sp.]|nr:hypothetical protein [Candidatus Obscuribacter sp.]